jgi:hypothetical protein
VDGADKAPFPDFLSISSLRAFSEEGLSQWVRTDQSAVDKKSLWYLWFVVVSFGVIPGSDLVFQVISSGFES